MPTEWNKLTDLTRGKAFTVDRVRLKDENVALEGQFDPPPLALLDASDLAFVTAFIHCHGSIRQMEKWFGVSYPTIKARLNRIASAVPFVDFDPPEPETSPQPEDRQEIFASIEKGDMSVDEAILALRGEEEA